MKRPKGIKTNKSHMNYNELTASYNHDYMLVIELLNYERSDLFYDHYDLETFFRRRLKYIFAKKYKF